MEAITSQNYSGKFVIRMPPKLHQTLSQKAVKENKSLNKICTDLLKSALDTSSSQLVDWKNKFEPTIKGLQKKFGDDLLGILLFGSQVSGQATSSSDWDFLIVLQESIPLQRMLYRWWDNQKEFVLQEKVNPQFVHLPLSPQKAGGLWFEVSLAYDILWEKSQKISQWMERLKKEIASDKIRRYWSNGHPFWVWKTHEK